MVEKGERKNKGDTWGQKPGKHQTARHKKQWKYDIERESKKGKMPLGER